MRSQILRRAAVTWIVVVIVALAVGLGIGRVPSVSPIPFLLAGPALVLFVALVTRRPELALCLLCAGVVLGWDQNTLAFGSVDLRVTDVFFVALVIWVIFARRRDPDARGADVGQRQLLLWFGALAISLYPVIILSGAGELTEPLLAVLRLLETLSLVWIVPYVARNVRDLRVIFGVLAAILTYEVGRSIISQGLAGSLNEQLEGANSKNTMGLLAAILVILALAAPLLPRSGRAVMLVVGLAGVVLARSIGSIAALALVVAFFGVTSQASKSRDARRARRLLTLPRLLVLVAIGLVLTSVLRPDNVASSSGQFNRSTTVHRQVLATAGLQLFVENPIVGVGWARAPEEIGSVRIDEVLRKQFGDSVNPEFFPRKNPTNVHNAYVEVLAETGIVGVILFLMFVITAFRRIRGILNDPSLSADAMAYARCAAAIVLAIAVWFNDNAVFGNQPETVLLAVMLGVLAAIPAVDRRSKLALEQDALS
jgi:O-antigen ligase